MTNGVARGSTSPGVRPGRPSGVVTHDEHDRRDDDRAQGERQLSTAEWADQAVLRWLVGEPGSFVGHVAQTNEVKLKNRGSRLQPVEDHRQPDERHEQAADEADRPAVPHERRG